MRATNQFPLWLKQGLTTSALLVALLWCLPGQASHYYLTDLKRFETERVVQFREQGIQTTEHVLAASITPQGRKALASKVGLSEDALTELARDCELMQITGVGPKAAQLLRAAGVVGLEDLSTRKADDLLARMHEVNKDLTYTSKHPTLDLIQYWIAQATKAPLKLRM